MVGHASMLVQVAGLNILTDPVWSDCAAPFGFAGPKRVTAPGIRLRGLARNRPRARLAQSLRPSRRRDAEAVAGRPRPPISSRRWATTRSSAAPRSMPGSPSWTGAAGSRSPIGITIDAEPAHHRSARGTGDRSMALPGSFVIFDAVGQDLPRRRHRLS